MKRILIIAMICSVCLTASGCFNQSSSSSEPAAVTTQPAAGKASEDTAPSASVKPTEKPAEKTTEKPTEKAKDKATEKTTVKPTEKPKKADWRSLYTDYISKLGKDYENASYALIQIDDDDIPELLINNKTFHGGGKTLLWVHDGKLKSQTVSDMSGGDFGYGEKKGMFWNMYNAQGSYYSLYSFSDGALAVKDTAEYSTSSNPKYKVNGEEASKSAYEDTVAKITSSGTSRPLYESKDAILDNISTFEKTEPAAAKKE